MWTCTPPRCPAAARPAAGWGASPHFPISDTFPCFFFLPIFLLYLYFCIFITFPYHATYNFRVSILFERNLCSLLPISPTSSGLMSASGF